LIGAVGALAGDRSSPVVVAIVGEFNAGKSTFINALIGADVAPTGVLPTTAAPHHLMWAPDAFAKILLGPGAGPAERVVAPADLRATLAGIDPATVRRVEIRLPLAFLARVEVLDTPGFNAAPEGHQAIAQQAIEEADIAVWLVDATQAMKRTEREVLEQTARLRVPVQVLINKADRLPPGDLPHVLDLVREGLDTTGLTSWRPPCALSSKLALAGRLGDAAALRASGWESVQALLDEAILARSDELKELTLRRRAARIVGRLISGYEGVAADEQATLVAHDERAHRAARAAAALEQDFDATEARVASALEGPSLTWARDLAMVFVARDPSNASHAARDPVLARYRIDRALTLLAPVLVRQLADLSLGAMNAVDLVPVARAIVRTAAAAASDADEAPQAVRAICRASVATLVERLFARAAASPPDARAGGPLRELRAFAQALQGQSSV
jgi:GTP-binding protein EngB required for normal cell division